MQHLERGDRNLQLLVSECIQEHVDIRIVKISVTHFETVCGDRPQQRRENSGAHQYSVP